MLLFPCSIRHNPGHSRFGEGNETGSLRKPFHTREEGKTTTLSTIHVDRWKDRFFVKEGFANDDILLKPRTQTLMKP